MIFDVQSILKTDGARVQVQSELTPPADFQQDGIVFGEISFSGELENIGGVLELTGCAEGLFTVPCGRCMKTTEQSFHVSVHETLAGDHVEISNRDAVIPFTGTCIDMDAVIWPEIFLALDTKYLCRPDCKGLCVRCGADLNEGPCGCREDDIDPRMAGLAKLLQ